MKKILFLTATILSLTGYGQEFNNGIETSTGFSIQEFTPIDERFVASDSASLYTLPYIYEGMFSVDKETWNLWIYDGIEFNKVAKADSVDLSNYFTKTETQDVISDSIAGLKSSLYIERFNFDELNVEQEFTLAFEPTQVERVTITNSDIFADESEFTISGTTLTVLSELKDGDIVRIWYWNGQTNTTSYSKNESDGLFYLKVDGENLEEVVYNIADGTGGKAYPDLTTAMAVDPLPEDNVIFSIDESNETEKGIYAYDSTEVDGYRFVREFIRVDEEFDHLSENPPSSKAISDFFLDVETETSVLELVSFSDVAVSGAGTHYGWGFPIGNMKDVYAIDFRVATQAGVTMNSVRVRVKIGDASGDVLYDQTVSTSITGVNQSYLHELNTVIKNENEDILWVEIFANEKFGIYWSNPATVFPYPDFPKQNYTTNSDMGESPFTTTNPVTARDIYVKIHVVDSYDFKVKETLLPEVISLANDFQPANETEAISAKSTTDFIFDSESTDEEFALVNSTNSAYGVTNYGWGFVLGNPEKLKSVTIKYATNAGDITQLRVRVKKGGYEGEILYDETFSESILDGQTAQEYTYEFEAPIENLSKELIWLELYADNPIRLYTVNPAQTWIVDEGYPSTRWSTSSSAISLGVLSSGNNNPTRDIYARFVSEETDRKIKPEFLPEIESDDNATILPNENERYSLVGSSVTWEDGFLQSGYVANLIIKLQERAKVYHASQFVGTKLNDRKHYRGQALLLGENDEIEFKLNGNEISIVQSIDRVNTNASEIEVYIDGELYDTFNNFNPSEIGTDSKEFEGDGVSVMFDLGRAFTYDHEVTVNGTPQVVTHNVNTGVGFTIPSGSDCAIIRKLGTRADGTIDVNHYLWFKTAPANGADIVIDFNYGEEINYEKSTIGKSTNGTNECPYGDGVVSFDPLQPASIGSGLDFRETDERAIKTYRFIESKERTVKLKVKGLYGEASGTPYFRFNFATNRIFHFQNAGIGGWSLSRLLATLNEDPTRNWQNVLKFNPDKIVFEATPNDDWAVAGYKLYKIDTANLTTLRKIKTLPLRHITYQAGTDDYQFSRWRAEITGITKTSVTFDGVVDSSIEKGNVLLIGQYWSNNTDYIERVVESFDSGTNTIYFNKPIQDEEIIYNDLQDFIGKDVGVRDLSTFTNNMQSLIDKFDDETTAEMYFLENPMPNVVARELWGYPLAIRLKTNQNKNAFPVNYLSLREWQISQPTTSVIVDVDDAEIDNYLNLDVIYFGDVGQNLVFTDILKDGVSIYGKGAVVENGWAYVVEQDKSGTQLNKSPSFNAGHLQVYNGVSPRVIILDDTLTGELEVRYATNRWSVDSCHMSGANGEELYADFLFDILK